MAKKEEKKTKANVITEPLAPDYQVVLAKKETTVNIYVKDNEYSVIIGGLKEVRTLDDLLDLRQLLNTAIEDIELLEDAECEECDCHTGPCYA